MKQRTKLKIDMLPILGITGLLFVLLFFLVSNFSGDSTAQSQKDPYYLFAKLYRKLGYRLTDVSLTTLPRVQSGDLLIYFDYNFDYNNQGFDIKPFLTINRWVNRGGSVLIAGIQGTREPFGLLRLKTSLIKTIQIDSAYAADKRTQIKLVSVLQRNYLKHFIPKSDLTKRRIILNSKAGPLLYQTTQDKGTIFVLSDSALLTNEYLRDDNTAVFFNRLLAPYFTKRIFLIRKNINGAGQTVSILALLFQDKLLFITLQLIWILGLFIAWQGKRFGSPQLIDPYARRALSEHLKAVGHFYQKTHSLKIIEEINLDYFKYMLHRITGFQWKDPPSPEDLEKMKRISAAGAVSQDQLMECLKKDPATSSSRMQNKAKIQERILKALQPKK